MKDHPLIIHLQFGFDQLNSFWEKGNSHFLIRFNTLNYVHLWWPFWFSDQYIKDNDFYTSELKGDNSMINNFIPTYIYINTFKKSLSFDWLILETLYSVIHQNRNRKHAVNSSCRLFGVRPQSFHTVIAILLWSS